MFRFSPLQSIHPILLWLNYQFIDDSKSIKNIFIYILNIAGSYACDRHEI